MLSFLRRPPIRRALFGGGLAAPLFLVATISPLLAKRAAPPEVKPVHHEGVIYSVIQTPEKMGYITATDEKTGRKLWERKVYDVRMVPDLEADAQWVFITNMEMKDDQIAVTNEQSDCFLFDPKLRRPSQTPPRNIVLDRFPWVVLSAVRQGTDAELFPLEGRLPAAGYDKKTKRMDVGPVIQALEAQGREAKPLTHAAYQSFFQILSDPENHQSGLYAVGEPSLKAIKFQFQGKTGWIILHHSLVVLIWSGRQDSCLLNEKGTKALQEWAAANP